MLGGDQPGADEERVLIPDLHYGYAHLTGGYTLAWIVDEDGDRWPFILDARIQETVSVPYGPGIEHLAPHELTGPLPDWMAVTRSLLEPDDEVDEHGSP